MPIIKLSEDDPYPCIHGHIRRRTSSGRVYCPECNNIVNGRRKEEIDLYKKQWANENQDRVRESHRRNAHKHIEFKAKWYLENRGSIREKAKDNIAKKHPLYRTWHSMNDRCHLQSHPNYKNYGGRGIFVCDEWRRAGKVKYNGKYRRKTDQFDIFVRYVDEILGPKPTKKHSLDRIDNDKGYEPGNLRWASKREQANNRRPNLVNRVNISDDHLVEDRFTPMTIREISDKYGIDLRIVKDRYGRYGQLKYILNKTGIVGTHYPYKGHNYSALELERMSGIPSRTLQARIDYRGWSVEKAVESPYHPKPKRK